MSVVSLRTASLFFLLFSALPQGPTPGFTRFEGAVYVKKDGRPAHIYGALVEIYRVDVRRRWEARSDNTGIYSKFGIPRYGKYLVILSAPGIKPAYVANIEPGSEVTIVNIYTEPGDGSRLSYDEVLRLISRERIAGPPATRPAPAIIELNNEKLDLALKDSSARGALSTRLRESLAMARASYERGVELLKAGDYERALAEFEQAAAFDFATNREFAELSFKSQAMVAESRFLIGSAHLAAKNTDAARPHIERAIGRITEAISFASSEDHRAEADDLLTLYSLLGKSAKTMVGFFGAVPQLDGALRLLEQAAALDRSGRSRWLSLIGNLNHGAARVTEAALAYRRALSANPQDADALYNLSMILLMSEDKQSLQQSANLLSDFLNSAPDDERATGVRLALEMLEQKHKVSPQPVARRK